MNNLWAWILFISVTLMSSSTYGQKPGLSIEDIANPPSISFSELSNNGKFILYSITDKQQKSLLNLYDIEKKSTTVLSANTRVMHRQSLVKVMTLLLL